ncbi:Hsp20/alpha crystallin family protein [Mucilaginibacter sp. BJC16-A38]|uniref:Hsp20/alpha crystallin family protein n=1 Tax=Mucilaginibacter phenanthrenivorans TaxID=1234842 RepID=UPI002157DD6A|nr:Hsp20/alpha crystallin family protein [Mucilaginibacter phenanthrenivorans]MCR8560785.1 Hsp20/alpha crystallin family protein [Mucilaginibacter phenanthrenivorans]
MSHLVKSHRSPSLRSMMEDFWSTDRFFDKPFNGELLPAVNIRETKNHYKLDVSVPGFKKDDFKITTEDGLLTISAETSNEQNEEKENYTRREFSSSSFTRTFHLPENVEEDNISANYQNGLLEIELKKSGKSSTAKKEIKVA